ncbi:hypothetical protein NM688_g9181 [Phlebia brevispora]|uniref:Uncharacterized protein n=1 Tax=Phlebia brevispora TaxID=194682 RepID=A0ACC1RKH2_9APHY|nr:hypothetical protein NM688_g9181 [Phlebia brevispora]
MSFANLYYKRAVGTPRACYVCYKPTTTVLATINTVDFVYVCDTHLTDPGFATEVKDTNADAAGGPKKAELSPEEIAKVKEEWEERQKRKQEKAKEKEKEEKEKEKDKDGKEKDDKDSKEASKEKESKKSASKSPPPTSPPSSTPATPSHPKYTLHRDIFSMRVAEHRRRRQTAQAQALAPRLPGAPKAPLPSS